MAPVTPPRMPPLLQVALVVLLLLCTARPSQGLLYEYILQDSLGLALSQLVVADVMNLELVPITQVVIQNPNSTTWSVQNVRARTTIDGDWTALSDYKTAHSGSLTPYPIFRDLTGSPLNLDIQAQFSASGFMEYMFEARNATTFSWDTCTFSVVANASVMCATTQTGLTSSSVCQNGGTCVADVIGSYCECPINFAAPNCSACSERYTNSPACNACLPGYYGSSCQTCPSCYMGECDSGIDGTGVCLCNPGWGDALCDSCSPGFLGANCSSCAFGFYGSSCAPCPSCGSGGTCNGGISGNGSCTCAAGWTVSGDGTCDICAPGFYGEDCSPCPACGSGTCNDGLGGDGTCICEVGWNSFASYTCNSCASGYYGSSCAACPSCGPQGTCDAARLGSTGGTGQCICATGWVSSGGVCNACAAGFYGPSCAPCPSCGSGTCSQGLSGTGVCTCLPGWDTSVTTCDSCAPGYYGPGCAACPACGADGTCSQGLSGTGQCVCATGWMNSSSTGPCSTCAQDFYGSSCTPCPSCGSEGVCQDGFTGSGACTCSPGWANKGGLFCSACASGYYGSNCTACPSCGAHGSCGDGLTGSGACACATGWQNGGSTCNVCSPGYYGPLCTPCPTCGAGGTCEDGSTGSGACACSPGWADGAGYCDVCAPGFTGASCSQCQPGYYGSSCAPCPNCLQGTCNDGMAGTGACMCQAGWSNATDGSCDVCAPGFTGPACASCAPGYFGANCTACPACGGGTCNDGLAGNGACVCVTGFALTSGVCDACAPGYYGPDCTPCQSCGPRGTCQDGISGAGNCTCATGWAPDSITGACTQCAANYYGQGCSLCPACGPQGICDSGITQTGICNCNAGWTSTGGYYCNTCQGAFSGPNCTTCAAGTYPSCYNPVPCPNGCNGNGACNLQTGVCACDPRFTNVDCSACMVQTDTYPSCSRPISCPNSCSSQGFCNYTTGQCACAAGFALPDCGSCLPGFAEFPTCYEVLSCAVDCGPGACDNMTGTCACPPGYTGAACDSCLDGFEDPAAGCWPVVPCPNNCDGHGTCNLFNGTCSCDYSYFGASCQTQLFCLLDPCQNGGTCTELPSSFSCQCHPDYDGEACEYFIIAPEVTSVSPSVGSLHGVVLTVTGLDFESPLSVTFSYGDIFSATVTVTPTSLTNFTVTTPATTYVGYYTITVINPCGLNATYTSLYLTDDCPEAGEYALNNSCSSCPAHATCPGGDRVWPLPGYWSPDELSPPYACPLPSSRCLGGSNSSCAVGYRGELCSLCADGYQVSSSTGGCEPCPSSGCVTSLVFGTSAYFLFTWLAFFLFLAILFAIVKLRQRNSKKNAMKKAATSRKEKRSSARLSRGISIPLKLSDLALSELDPHLAKPSPFSPHAAEDDEAEEEGEEERVPLAPLGGSARRPLRAIGKKATFSLPTTLADDAGEIKRNVIFDVEAVILDRTLRTVPTRDGLYTQVIKTSKPDLTLARVAHQVTKQILKSHEKDIVRFDDKQNPVGLVDEAEIQKLVERYIESASWRVVGQMNAISKGLSQAAQFLQRTPFDLPYFVQIGEAVGSRPTAHNRWIAPLYANELMGLGSSPNISLIGLYSGFGGPQCADFVARHLHVNFLKNENFKRNPYAAFLQAFLQTDEGYAQVVRNGHLSDIVGCVATLCMIRGSELWFSWVGDSRAVVVKSNGQVIDFCEPQTPDRDSERERLESKGGRVVARDGHQRFMGVYPISRAFGCPRLKKHLISEPEIVTYDLQGDEDYLVIANSAFWSVVTDNDLSEILTDYEGAQVSGMADALVAYARSLGVQESLTVFVLGFEAEY